MDFPVRWNVPNMGEKGVKLRAFNHSWDCLWSLIFLDWHLEGIVSEANKRVYEKYTLRTGG